MLALICFVQFKPDDGFGISIYLLSGALIIALQLSPESPLKKLLRSNVLTWLGALSYSIYMSHQSVEWVVVQIFRVFLKRPQVADSGGRLIPHLSIYENAVAYFLAIAGTILVGQIVYNYVEMPLREKSRRFISRLGAQKLVENTDVVSTHS